MNSDFDPPPKSSSLLASVGGVVTAIAMVAGLESLSGYFHKTTAANSTQPTATAAAPNISSNAEVARLDAQSMKVPDPSASALHTGNSPHPGALSPQEQAMAKQAWQYFQRNWNEKTGLVNSADGFASVTLWDQAAAMAALVSAKELSLVPEAEFTAKMKVMLKTLATLPLYKNELPNKVYNSKTLLPVNYGKLDKREEIGWSAIDLGRIALWLKIVNAKYPQLHPQAEAVWQSWQVTRLVKAGQMYGTTVVNGKERYNQEGRLGYESYAAYGLKLWKLDVQKALNTQSNLAFVNLYGQDVPYDRRDYKTSGANNYVLSEPFILDGIETGFQALPKAHADQVLAAQVARYRATGQLTALTEDNLDQDPYFVYNTLFVNGEPWATITDTRQKRNDLRFLSAKAAIGWHVLYNTPYTQKLFDFVQTNLKADAGWYNGFYEASKQPNRSLTANNNGVILESLLYKKLGQPFTVWAGVQP
ncbi:MAG: DUF3131 domain-containing protein [Scytolyngbya sp. HA4215-MV1]|jgi:hypothetical protein|nr:DUF3131 domain-containing protein [Scytolyngbya sp. HA4215-MV1]